MPVRYLKVEKLIESKTPASWDIIPIIVTQTPVADPKTGVKSDKVTAFIVERKFGGVSHGELQMPF